MAKYHLCPNVFMKVFKYSKMEKEEMKIGQRKIMIQIITITILSILNVSTPSQKHCLIIQESQLQIYALKMCWGYKIAGRLKLRCSESDVMITLNKENYSQCTRQASRNGQRIGIAKGITSLKK